MHAARPFAPLGTRTHKARGVNIFVKVSKNANFERSQLVERRSLNSFSRERHVPVVSLFKGNFAVTECSSRFFLTPETSLAHLQHVSQTLFLPRNDLAILILITDPMTNRLLRSQNSRGRSAGRRVLISCFFTTVRVYVCDTFTFPILIKVSLDV